MISDERFEPIIWTSRVHCGENEDPAESENAKQSIREWLMTNGLTGEEVESLRITNEKPPAILIIDDRAFKFEGMFPTRHYLDNFQPWKPEGENS